MRDPQILKSRNASLEQLDQVLAAAEPRSMHEQIAETMSYSDWDDFWQVLIAGVIIKRRIVRNVILISKLMLTQSRYLPKNYPSF
jgi:hypothetical protein